MTKYVPAVLCAAGIVAIQWFYGGLFRQVLAFPGFLVICVAALAGGLTLFGKRDTSPRSLPLFLVAALSAWLLWRISEAPVWMETRDLARLVLACALVFFLFAGSIVSPRARMAFLGLLILAAVIQSSLGAYQFLKKLPDMPIPWASEALRSWYAPRLGGRSHGFYFNGNHLAWLLNFAGLSALSLACWAKIPVWARLVTFYGAAVCLVGCLPTLSRGGYIAMAAGLSVFLLASAWILITGGEGRRLAAGLAVTMALLIASGGAWFVFSKSPIVQARLSQLTDDTYRGDVFAVGQRLFETNPILGAGAATFKDAARALRNTSFGSDDVFTHNDWLQLAAEFGFPAFALVCLLMAALFFHGFRGIRRWLDRGSYRDAAIFNNGSAVQVAGLSALAACAVHSIFDFNMQIPANALLAAACAGMLANDGRRRGSPNRFQQVHAALPVLGALVCAGLLLQKTLSSHAEYHAHLRTENALYRQELEDAIALASEYLDINPQSVDVRLLRARAFLRRSYSQTQPTLRIRDAVAAAADFETSSWQKPLDAFQLTGLAMARGQAGSLRASKDAAAETIQRAPRFYGGYFALARNLEMQNQLHLSLRLYQVSVTLPNARPAGDRLRNLRDFLRNNPMRSPDL